MLTDLSGIFTYEELFKKHPDKWILCKVLKRENKRISKVSIVMMSLNKSGCLEEAKKLKKQGEDVAVVCTIEELEAVNKVLFAGDEVESMDYVTSEEWAFIFQMAVGMPISKEYLA